MTNNPTPQHATSSHRFSPLSHYQQGIWLGAQSRPDGAEYNMVYPLHIRAALNVAALQQALQALVDRHALLRVTYPLQNGLPVQQIHAYQTVAFQQIVATEQLDDTAVRAWAETMTKAPYDLVAGPLFRVRLLTLAADDHLLLLMGHHIVLDMISWWTLLDELEILYSAFATSTEAVLPPLGKSYPEFTNWHQAELATKADRMLAYWQQQLVDAPAVLELPTDRPRRSARAFRGATTTFCLPDELTNALRQLALSHNATLYTTLLAAYQLFLGRLAQQTDLIVGTPFALRPGRDFRQTVGLFADLVPLRADLSDNPRFCDLLTQVSRTVMGALVHQIYPFYQLLDQLKLKQDPSYTPLFQSTFQLERTDRTGFAELLSGAVDTQVTWAGLPVTTFPVPQQEGRTDLTLIMYDNGQSLFGTLLYDTDLFDAATVQRWSGHFQTLLQQIVTDPQAEIGSYSLLTPAERHQLLVEWNDRSVGYSADKCLHQLFEEQVSRTPDAIAVYYPHEDVNVDEQAPPNFLTYRELNVQANQVAHALIAQGVGGALGSETPVALYLERGLEMVVALLGALKAGGAYVPLDLAHPAERLAFVLADANVKLLLTQTALATELPAALATYCAQAEVQPICVDSPAIQTQAHTNPIATVGPDNLAYIIYTSGSTGRPKGVLIEHRGLANLVAMELHTFDPQPADRVLQFASFGFDASVWDLIMALMSGATLCVAPQAVRLSASALGALMQQQAITIATLTPSILALLAPEDFPDLRIVISTGEACPPEIVARWAPYVRFFNGYGPTEATVGATIGECFADGRKPHIGRSFLNKQIYLLDEERQPVPIGVPGMLYIGGIGLARGYLNRPELTAELFVPNPFGAGRLYKTGDFARYLADGTIDFLGRRDNQVQIRGLRIELGEIEAMLGLHPVLQEAVVVAQSTEQAVADGPMRLVAYVVAAQQADGPTPALLRDFLKQKLPNYMIPAAFVVLDALPLTTNGKVDRNALPAPVDEQWGNSTASVPPSTPTEVALAAIWAELLDGIDPHARIGIHDDFFELGGHSLLATQVASRIEATFAITLPLRTIFASSTIATLAAAIDAAHLAQPTTIPPIADRKQLPLSFAQQRFWFFDQWGSRSAYNIPMVFKLTGDLNIAALQQALQEIVQRHESLRTTFAMTDGTPYQWIQPHVPIDLPCIDLRSYPPVEQAAAVTRLATAEAAKPFDLRHDPLLRATLLCLGDTSTAAPPELVEGGAMLTNSPTGSVEPHGSQAASPQPAPCNSHYHLLLTLHHIGADGWSGAILLRELSELYSAFSQGKPSPLPDLAIQYADFAVWQRNYLQGERLTRQLAYWQARLAGAPALLQLPTDRPRPAQQRFRGAAEPIAIDAELTQRLRALSTAHGATLYMTLLATFQVLLLRHTGQTDLVVGMPIANRNQRATEPLIGCFVNTLAIRSDLSDVPSFLALLAQVQQRTQEAYDHQDLPFERLIEELQLERALNYNPLLQVVLSLQNTPKGALTLPGLQIEPLTLTVQQTRFDLELHLEEVDNQLQGLCAYNTDLFDAATILRLLGHFQELLQSVVTQPHQPITQLPMLRAAESHQLLVDWNATAAPYPNDRALHQLFEAQVNRTPDAIALCLAGAETGHVQLTYRALNARANQLAHTLRARGVGPETLVGICMERSLELVVGLLAILKAGGAYVPFEPSTPAERLAFLLTDTAVTLVLTTQKFQGNFPPSVALLCLDTPDAIPASAPHENVPTQVTAENLAYIMYTSGSTGVPKGVCVTQRNVARLVLGSDFARFSAEERWLQLAPISFDASTLELWGALLHGAQLVLAPPATPSAAALGELIRHHQITSLWLTAGLFHLMVDEQLDALRPLRQLLAGGDVLSVRHVARAIADLPQCRFINGYGPTENTTFTCCFPVSDLDPAAFNTMTSVPIGKPIANTTVYILDAALQPRPIGVTGELYTGGDGVARGYHNRPALTAERFIPNPFGPPANPGRLYRTGDLARWRTDGTIEFLGRSDNQVKLRGFRIELGEIETVLGQHPAVQDTAVIADEEPSGDKRLVAYVVAKSNGPSDNTPSALCPLSSAALQRYLTEKLPAYMVPAAFVFLETLPLTPNGKLDRHALPAPREGTQLNQAPLAAPTTATEVTLTAIWAELLGLPSIGLHDNFFALGGHSLLAIQAVSRIRRTFALDLPLPTFFEAATVAEVAASIDQLRETTVPATTLPIPCADRSAPLPLSHAQERLWFLDQLGAARNVYNIPIALRLLGQLDANALEAALQELVQRHESLRTTFVLLDDRPVQQIHAPCFALAQLDLRHLSERTATAEVDRLIRAEVNHRFDLQQGPLFRATLVRMPFAAGQPSTVQTHILLLNLHHSIADGWSVQILQRELGALYQAFGAGNSSPLAPMALQYADFALWQRQWLTTDTVAPQLAYWQENLADAPPLLLLPTDRPRPPMQRYEGAAHPFTIAPDLAAALRQLSRAQNATLFMTLLAAFKLLLMRYSGQTDVVVGTPVANRNRLETEPLVGFFVNTLALRTNVEAAGNAADLTFTALLAQVKATTLQGYQYQDVPFEKVIDQVQPVRDLSYAPLFQVMFDLMQQEFVTFALPGLQVETLPVDHPIAKFDLNVMFIDGAHTAEEDPTGSHALEGIIEYNTDLFDASTIERMATHFQTLLRAIVADPTQPIQTLPLLSTEARRQLLVAWNETQTPFPADKCIHQLFAEQAARTPEATALVVDAGASTGPGVNGDAGVTTISYRELDHRANQLAHYLQTLHLPRSAERSIQMPIRIGICMERSVEMVVGVLGVLKAGGLFVPLDPTDPPARRNYMVDVAQVSLILVQAQTATLFEDTAGKVNTVADPERESAGREELSEVRAASPSTSPSTGSGRSSGSATFLMSPAAPFPEGPQLLCLDTDWAAVARKPTTPPHTNTDAGDPAYIVFTSGSTGNPKGVVGHHRGVVNFVHYIFDRYQLNATDVVLQLPRLTFDASLRDMLGPLMVGAKVVMLPQAAVSDPRVLLHRLKTHNVTCLLSIVPTLLTMLVETARLQNLPTPAFETLRLILVSGEPLYQALAQAARTLVGPQVTIVNQYGPTECTMTSTYYVVPPLSLEQRDHNAIALAGRPIQNCRIFIVDAALNPVPLGVAGEILIGGVGLTHGYLPATAPTPNPFVPNPFLAELPATMGQSPLLYRTGDRGRFRPDGQIEFLGRLDHQIKLRGVRIELGEIEATLARFPGVREAAVLVQHGAAGNDRLIAYLTPAPGQTLVLAEVRSALSQTLPDYMVPAHFVLLEQMPLTPNGKINRRALPLPETTHDETALVPPRTPLEASLVAIWQEVLEVDPIGVDHNFFAVGGNSLLATQVTARIQQRLQLDLPLRQLFHLPTIAALADYLAKLQVSQVLQATDVADDELREELVL